MGPTLLGHPMTSLVQLISFGYRHAPPPEADITLDTRRLLRDPHVDPALRELTGLDEPVRTHVMNTPGALCLIVNTAATVRQLFEDLAVPHQVVVAVGCAGGRHRSVALTEQIAALLDGGPASVAVHHRDVDRPVLPADSYR
jgi:UPF0042 nucleotide-binding protein